MTQHMRKLSIFIATCSLIFLVMSGAVNGCPVIGNCGPITATPTTPVVTCYLDWTELTVTASDCDTENGVEKQDKLEYLWDFGDGSPYDITFEGSTTWLYAVPGEYTVTVYIDDFPVYYDDPQISVQITVKVIGGDIDSLDACGGDIGKLLLLCNPAGSSPVDEYQAWCCQPNGTTYKWEVVSGSGGAQIVGADTGSTVGVQATAEGTCQIKLTYTNSGTNCVETLDTEIQKPSQANSQIYSCSDSYGKVCSFAPPYYEVHRDVYYVFRDSSGRPVPHALWDESLGGNCGFLPAGGWDGPVLCDGTVYDEFWVAQQWQCAWVDWVYCTATQTLKVGGWPVSGSFLGPWTIKFQTLATSGPDIDHDGCP